MYVCIVPPVITSEGPNALIVVAGKSVTLGCETEGDPRPHVSDLEAGHSQSELCRFCAFASNKIRHKYIVTENRNTAIHNQTSTHMIHIE